MRLRKQAGVQLQPLNGVSHGAPGLGRDLAGHNAAAALGQVAAIHGFGQFEAPAGRALGNLLEAAAGEPELQHRRAAQRPQEVQEQGRAVAVVQQREERLSPGLVRAVP